MLAYKRIKELASIVGFDLCGVTKPRVMETNKAKYMEWLERGDGSPLEYMSRYQDVRFDASALMEGTKSIVVCAVNYKNQFSLENSTPKIASYAHCTDYHKSIRKMLKALLREIKVENSSINGRCCVDTAPLLEKQIAVDAGLGWIGRQSLLVTPEHGSFVVLGELLLDCEIDEYDTPLVTKGCGECRRCVDSCPNEAINQDHTINTRRCVSCQTVECDNSEGTPLNGWIFGCDDCQSCCPFNQRTPLSTNPLFAPIIPNISHIEWTEMNQQIFDERTSQSPLKRAGLERIVRNIEK